MLQMRNSALLFAIFLLIYAIGSFSKIPFGDCMGFVVNTEVGDFIKTATSTSHFLYINTAILVKEILNIDAILANRILVVFSAAFVVMMVYKSVQLVVKTEWISIVSAIVFGLSFSFWRNAEIVEVYTFNLVWVSLFLYFLLKSFLQESGRERNILLATLLLAVSLWAHIQNMFFIPSLLLSLFYLNTSRKTNLFGMFIISGSFSLMILLNSYSGLPAYAIFKSGSARWVEATFEKDLVTYLKDLFISFAYLFYNFNVFTFFGILGGIALFKYNRKLFFAIAPAAVTLYGFATFYAVSDNYVFFLPFNLIFSIGVGLGIKSFKYQEQLARWSPLVVLIPVFYVGSFYIAKSIPAAKNFDEFKTYKGGLAYYMLPWMNDNVGILEFTIEDRTANEEVSWMTKSAHEYIDLLQKKGYTEEELKAH